MSHIVESGVLRGKLFGGVAILIKNNLSSSTIALSSGDISGITTAAPSGDISGITNNVVYAKYYSVRSFCYC